MSDTIKPLLAKLVDGQVLTEAEGHDFFAACLRGEPTPAQVAAAVTALRIRGETVPEITAFARAMRSAAAPFETPFDVIDTCGTGGDGQHTYNISTAAGAAGVDHLVGMIQRQGGLAHGLGEGGDLVHGLPPNAQGGHGGRDLGRGRFAAQAGGEEVVRLFGRQGVALDQSGEDRLETIGHGQAAMIRRPRGASRRRSEGSWPACRGHVLWRWIPDGTERHGSGGCGAGAP